MADYSGWRTNVLEELVRKYKDEIKRNNDEAMRQQLTITLKDMENELSARPVKADH